MVNKNRQQITDLLIQKYKIFISSVNDPRFRSIVNLNLIQLRNKTSSESSAFDFTLGQTENNIKISHFSTYRKLISLFQSYFSQYARINSRRRNTRPRRTARIFMFHHTAIVICCHCSFRNISALYRTQRTYKPSNGRSCRKGFNSRHFASKRFLTFLPQSLPFHALFWSDYVNRTQD